jgi:outer membrane biogenesis lipoprotein LolB
MKNKSLACVLGLACMLLIGCLTTVPKIDAQPKKAGRALNMQSRGHKEDLPEFG